MQRLLALAHVRLHWTDRHTHFAAITAVLCTSEAAISPSLRAVVKPSAALLMIFSSMHMMLASCSQLS